MSNDLNNDLDKVNSVTVANQENTGLRVEEQNMFKLDINNNDYFGFGEWFKIISKLIEPGLLKIERKQIEKNLNWINSLISERLIPQNTSFSIGTIKVNAGLNSVDERAIRAMVSDEINKQMNIEKIASKCMDYIDKDYIPHEEVDDDWLYTFRDSVKNISSEDLQVIWAKLLADEIQSPSTYSLRTLNILKNMSRQEAQMFKKFIGLTIVDVEGKNRISTDDTDILKKYGITYDNILLLKEIGLVQSGSVRYITPGDNLYIIDDYKIINIKNNDEEFGEIGVYNTSKVGTELAKIITSLDNSSNYEYIKEFIKKISDENTTKYKYDVLIGEDYKIIEDNKVDCREIKKFE